MTYSFITEFEGGTVILAPCFQVLCAEVSKHKEYKYLTNLGEIGDTRHAGQGTGSDHNPFVLHNGLGYVRACDFGGKYSTLMKLRGELYKLYLKRDRRVWPFGYFKGPDSLINNWTPNGQSDGWHRDSGDEGHLHVSASQLNGYNPSSRGWIPALDSRAPWLVAPWWTRISRHSLFPFKKPGHYFGDIDGSKYSHGGINDMEQAFVGLIQMRLVELGWMTTAQVKKDGASKKLPGTHIFNEETKAAVKRWQKAMKVKQSGIVGRYGWRRLMSDNAVRSGKK